VGNSAFVSQQGSGSGARLTVNQTTGNIVAGDVVRFDAASDVYVKAQADTAVNAEAVGVVESSTGSTINIVFSGLVDLSEATPDTGSFEDGTVYFLSNATAGKLTKTPPSTTGTVRKAMVTMMTATKGVVQNYIGLQNGVSESNLVDLSEVQPVGTVAPFVGSDRDIPKGWLLLNGDTFSATEYPDLASLVGDSHGTHAGDSYYLPDFRGKGAIGVNNSTENQTRNTAYATRELGDNGGQDTATLTTNNLPSHSHSATYKVYEDDAIRNQADSDDAVLDGTGPFDIVGGGVNTYGHTVKKIDFDFPITSNNWKITACSEDGDHRIVDKSVSVSSSGSNTAFNIRNPFVTINWIVKASAQADAALFTTNLSRLSDFDSGRGSATSVDAQKPGDMISVDGTTGKFVLKPEIGKGNLIDNPLLRVSQRGTSFNDTTSSQLNVMDRWYYSRNGSACFSISRETTGRPEPGIITASGNQVANYYSPPMSYWMKIQKNNDTTTAANAFYALTHAVEGYDFQSLWGSDFFTFSFLIQNDNSTTSISPATPITVVFRNANNSRSYVASVSSSSVTNGWVRKKITVPMAELQFADWQYEEGIGLQISFILGAGTSLRTTEANLNTWKSDNLYAHPNQINLNESGGLASGGHIGLTQFQLEAGAYATNLKIPTGYEELTKCQRYYQKSYDVETIPGSTDHTNNAPIGITDPAISNTCHAGVQFSTTMRAKPTVRLYDPYGGGSSRDGNVGTIYPMHSGNRQGTATAVNSIRDRGTKGFNTLVLNNDLGNYTQGDNLIHFHYTADADFFVGYNI